MTAYNRMREIVEGFRLGIRYSVSANQNAVAKGFQPSITPLNPEDFGR